MQATRAKAEPGFTLMSDFISEVVELRVVGGRARISVADFPKIGRQFGVGMEATRDGRVKFTCRICGVMYSKALCLRGLHDIYYDRLEEERRHTVEELVPLEWDRRKRAHEPTATERKEARR